ncbi:MAG: hypothetical protein MUE44_01655 [Oscillatoriaceae cyanobacterium Prado104]|jgi:hypothetical protein|nr:hypothetical protein [Oscillatoriaceae cyanobacterium Prado104]
MKVKALMMRRDYVSLHPEDSYLILHSCANQVLVGEEGTAIRFDTGSIPRRSRLGWWYFN